PPEEIFNSLSSVYYLTKPSNSCQALTLSFYFAALLSSLSLSCPTTVINITNLFLLLQAFFATFLKNNTNP
ncbi:hypothetical protein, partial [Lactobacillus sp. ESL0703]|uniref:hypothetical protein n=1 Tax=Lactobacillus sp. ESL0703 TaxID=2983218 RepID=UPI0023F7C3CB